MIAKHRKQGSEVCIRTAPKVMAPILSCWPTTSGRCQWLGSRS